MTLAPGTLVVGGQFRVLDRLGAGGFGTVYRVETVVGGLRRALKVLHAEWGEDARARDRFVNEAVVLERLHHPGIARCYAAGVLDDGRSLYLLLELVDGVPVGRLSDGDRAPLAAARAVRLGAHVASGLAVAHEAGILHRDLKPDNVLVTAAGTPREHATLVDFGIATALDAGRTTTRSVVGTPSFMAPEQLMPGEPLDARADLWQLGALLFVMLTGEAPYAATTVAELVAFHQRHAEIGPRPSHVNPALAACPALDDLVARLLASRREARPRSAAEVCEELARISHMLAPAQATGAVGLLEALCATPGDAAWRALCRYLGGDVPRRGVLVSTAQALLGAWPDELRVAPLAWWSAVRSGEDHALWPLARALDLSGLGLGDGDVRRIAESPALASMTCLTLARNEIGPDGALALATSPHLPALRSLDLSDNRIGSTGAEALAGSRRLPSLEILSLAANGVGPRGAQALARTCLPLRVLDLSANRIEPSGAAALAASDPLGGLEVLRAADNGIGSDGLAAIGASRTLQRLRELDVSDNAIGPSGAAALALSPNAGAFRKLLLGRNSLGVHGVELLATSNRFSSLERLDLSSNALGAAGAMALAASPLARRLEALELGDNGLGDTGLAALLGAAHLAGLRTLGLAQNQLTPAGIALIGGGSVDVQELDLSRNDVGEAGARAIAGLLGRLRLSTLRLNGCALGDGGVAAVLSVAAGVEALEVSANGVGAGEALAGVPLSGTLQRVDLSSNQLGARGVERLAASAWARRLRELALDTNEIGDAPAVLQLLERLPALERLSLQDNGIGPAGAGGLAGSLLPARITRLDLSWNALGDAGVSALLSGRAWASLQQLGLSRNDIGLAGCATVRSAPALPLLSRLDLSHNATRGLVDLHSLGDRRVTILEETFARLAPGAADLAEGFYAKLFARYPGVKPLFARVSMRGQQQHLMTALTMVIESLRSPDLVAEHLQQLGGRHRDYGVVATHYPAVAGVLMDTLRDALGGGWTEEVEAAWHDGLEAIARTMLQLPEPRSEAAARPAAAGNRV